MKFRIRSQKNFFSGLMFAAAGAAFAIGATNYNIGTGARMGPGYFPLMLGSILSVMGLFVSASSFSLEKNKDEDIGKIAWRPLFFVILANLVFGVLLGGLPSFGIPAMGLIAAVYALVLIAGLAGYKYSLKTCLIVATILAIGSYLTFIVGLSLQFQVWPTFFSNY